MSVRRSKPTSRPTILEMVRGLRKVRSKAERHVCAKLGDRPNYRKHSPKIPKSPENINQLVVRFCVGCYVAIFCKFS
ncbi:hypothetical protein QUA86_01435 [Microcoleus sp. F6_B6]